MPAQTLLITEVEAKEGSAALVAATWAGLTPPAPALQRELFIAHDDSTVLEILALPDLAALALLPSSMDAVWQSLGQHLSSDFRRQLLEFVEAPKACATWLPTTAYLQLRHVEVPPVAYDDYLAWRERTIFDVVRSADEVEVFLAYHSVVSSEPGVMFLSGFSGDVDAYRSVFNSPRYQQIVREAGTQFITGGDNGLYTKLYRRIAA